MTDAARGEGDIRADRGKDTGGPREAGRAGSTGVRAGPASGMLGSGTRADTAGRDCPTGGARGSVSTGCSADRALGSLRPGRSVDSVPGMAGSVAGVRSATAGQARGSVSTGSSAGLVIRTGTRAGRETTTAGRANRGSVTLTPAIRASTRATWASTPATRATRATGAIPVTSKPGTTPSSKLAAASLRGLPDRLDRPDRRIGRVFPGSPASRDFPAGQEAPAAQAGSSAARLAADGVRLARCVRRCSLCSPRNPATVTS